MKLTAKQQAFVAEYLVDLNATQAAIRAGYSQKTSGVMGYENLKKPQIQEAIQNAADQRAENTEITAERVLKEIASIAFSEDMETGINNKLKGLELLGKHLVLFTERIQHDGEVQFTKVVREIVEPKHKDG